MEGLQSSRTMKFPHMKKYREKIGNNYYTVKDKIGLSGDFVSDLKVGLSKRRKNQRILASAELICF